MGTYPDGGISRLMLAINMEYPEMPMPQLKKVAWMIAWGAYEWIEYKRGVVVLKPRRKGIGLVRVTDEGTEV